MAELPLDTELLLDAEYPPEAAVVPALVPETEFCAAVIVEATTANLSSLENELPPSSLSIEATT